MGNSQSSFRAHSVTKSIQTSKHGTKIIKKISKKDIKIRPQPVKENELRKGDHVAVECVIQGITVLHHGIIVRHKRMLQVVDFAPDSDAGKSGGTASLVKLKTLTDFRGSASAPFVRIQYQEGDSLNPKKVVKEAMKYVKKPDLFGDYHLVTNNCEHFATFIKTGIAASEQVDRIIGGDLLEAARVAVQYVTHKAQSVCKYLKGTSNEK